MSEDPGLFVGKECCACSEFLKFVPHSLVQLQLFVLCPLDYGPQWAEGALPEISTALELGL